MPGLFDKLTPSQKEAALSYQGPEDFGDPAFTLQAQEARRRREREEIYADLEREKKARLVLLSCYVSSQV
jgi:hypothetical protein